MLKTWEPERYERVQQDYKNGICASRNNKMPQNVFSDRDGTINKHVGF